MKVKEWPSIRNQGSKEQSTQNTPNASECPQETAPISNKKLVFIFAK